MKRILIADNIKGFVDGRAEILERAGYQVVKAYTVEQARTHLEQTWLHLAILDLRLMEEDDDNDRSGLDLAVDTRFASIPKIILTGFPSWETARVALGISDGGFQPAVAFCSKTDDINEFIETVNKAFHTHVKLNYDLVCHSKMGIPQPFHWLASFLSHPGQPCTFEDRVVELEDLFRRLFEKDHELLIGGLFWHTPTRLGVDVYAFDDRCLKEEFIVSVGDAGLESIEREGFETYRVRVRPPDPASPQRRATTLHYSAVAWTHSHLDTESSLPFYEFLRMAPNPIARTAVTRLLAETFNPALFVSQMQMVCLRDYLALPVPDDLLAISRQLASAAMQHGLAQVRFHDNKMDVQLPGGQQINLPYPNPNDPILHSSLELPVEARICLGNLNLSAVLVGEDERPWINDLSTLTPTPLPLALAELEMDLRRNLASTNLVSTYDFERQLLNAQRMGEHMRADDVEPECRKLLVTLLPIRAMLHEAREIDRATYLKALMLKSLSNLGSTRPQREMNRRETTEQLHCLLLASMLMETVRKSSVNTYVTNPASATHHTMELELLPDTCELQFNNCRVRLTNTELNLMEFLFRKAGLLCTREDLARDVFNFADPVDKAADRLINTNMDRLRQKIESIASEQTFLKTVRGRGYIFYLQPQAED